MKVKNIAFSGIMAAILMGASGANAAVEIASKQYVMNQVGDKATTAALESAQSTLQGAIDLKADKTALDATNEEVAKKANLSYVGTLETVNDTMPSSVVEYVKLKTAGIATDAALGDLGTRVTTAEGEIDTLQGTVGNETSGLVADVNALESMVGDKSVADQIATSLQSAKDYADGLATNYDAAGAADTALSSAKTYTDDEIAKLTAENGAITTLSGTVDGIAERVTTAEGEIDALQAADTSINNKIGTVAEGKTVVQMIEAAQTAATYDDTAVKADIAANAASIKTINEGAVMTSGINEEKVTQIGTNATAIATLNADAQTAGSVDNKIATAKATLLDKPVDNTCTAESGLCVLTLSKDGSKLVWIDVTDPADAE